MPKTDYPRHADGWYKSYDEMTLFEQELTLQLMDIDTSNVSIGDPRVQQAIVELFNGATVH